MTSIWLNITRVLFPTFVIKYSFMSCNRLVEPVSHSSKAIWRKVIFRRRYRRLQNQCCFSVWPCIVYSLRPVGDEAAIWCLVKDFLLSSILKREAPTLCQLLYAICWLPHPPDPPPPPKKETNNRKQKSLTHTVIKPTMPILTIFISKQLKALGVYLGFAQKSNLVFVC